MHTNVKQVGKVAVSKPWVLITGASSGFGAEFARQYARQGHPLVLVARRVDLLHELADQLRRQHDVEIVVEQADLADLAAATQLHQKLREHGVVVEILINNAGIALQKPFFEASLNDALAMIQLDITSLTAVTHVFGEEMRSRRRGKILLVASLLAYQGVETFAVYSAAKSYVLRLGEALHRESKAHGITVTVLCPGISDTGFASSAGMRLSPTFRTMMMTPATVVRAGIRALESGCMSVVPGLANKAMVVLMWMTPRWLHQGILSRAMKS